MTKNNRDDFSESVKKTLAERVAYRCSFQPCGVITVGANQASSSKTSGIGTACHITAAAPGGTRYDPNISREQRKSIENGIWMCGSHGRLIDTDGQTFTVEKLKQWKYEAESSAANSIGKVDFLPTEIVEAEKELQKLICWRFRDAINCIRYPIAIFVLRHTVEPAKSQMHYFLQSTDQVVPDENKLKDLLDALCNKGLRNLTTGALAPNGPNFCWIDWILKGIADTSALTNEILIIYGSRANPFLMVAMERMLRRANNDGYALRQIAQNQGDDLFGDVGRQFFHSLISQLLISEAAWVRECNKV